jgi:hypothetical protein
MNEPSYTATIVVDRTPDEAFAAITDVRGWWSRDIDGRTDELGAEFTYRAEDVHRSTMRIVELVPGERVVWLCLDNHFSFTNDKTEWIGTTISFEISRVGDRTRVRFTHLGLVPDYECFNVCSNAWGGYITSSLKNLIATGQGSPNDATRDAEALARHR